jgi:putative ABC transport system permease protein
VSEFSAFHKWNLACDIPNTMDVRFAIRSLFKNPGFTVLAVFVLALGMGANTAIFSVVNTLLLQPLPYPDADRIVSVYTKWIKSGRLGQVSAPDFYDWKEQSSSFSSFAYYASQETNVIVDGVADYSRVAMFSPGFFDVFQVKPLTGRLLLPEEEKKGAPPVALVSEEFWSRRLNRDSKVLGKQIRHGNRLFTIVGVVPFRFPAKTQVWYSANQEEENPNRTGHNYLISAKLKPGVTVAQANSELQSIAARITTQYPKDNANKSSAALLLQDDLVSGMRLTLGLLFAAVSLVVLIACANVANLLLAKATSRAREIAIRSAVGASRWQVIRLMLVESLFLAVIAAASGLLLAYWGVDVLVSIAPKDMARLDEVRLDWTVLAFSLATSLIATILFGLAPALTASKVDLNEALKQTSRTSSGSASKMRSALVVAEVALSVMLAIGAGLLVKSLIQLNDVPLGFQTERLLIAETTVPAEDLESAKRNIRFYRDVLPQLGSIPGVMSAGAITAYPGSAFHSNGAVQVEGRPFDGDWNKLPNSLFTVATPGLLQTIGIPLRAGRDFDDRDTADGPYTVLINESFAKTVFPNENPIGHRLRCGYDSEEWMTIIGIVGDIRQEGPARRVGMEMIMPYQQHPRPATYMSLMLRTQGEPTSIQEVVRTKIRGVNPEVPAKFRTMELALSDVTAQPRFRTQLLALLAALAVILAMIGVYGVMAYSVSQRLGEIGLRMALGADRSEVLRLIFTEGSRLAAIGLVIGLAAALAAGRFVESLLFQVKVMDPMVYGVVVLGAFIAVVLATWIPAQRAASLDPVRVLRQD